VSHFRPNATVFELFQVFRRTAIYPLDRALEYLQLGMISEIGEAANVYKKVIRDDDGKLTSSSAARLASELGDALWYVVMYAGTLCQRCEEGPMGRELDMPFEHLGSCVVSEPPVKAFVELTDWASKYCSVSTPSPILKVSAEQGVVLIGRLSAALHFQAVEDQAKDELSMRAIAESVADKLQDRMDRKVLSGSGDNR